VNRRSPILALLASLALPSGALAAVPPNHTTVVPPGDSGANQYVEVIPTAGGGTPDSGVRPSTHRSAAAVSSSTLSTLSHQGSAGQQAAALALATAPSTSASTSATPQSRPSSGRPHAARASSHRATGHSAAPATRPPAPPAPPATGAMAPAAAILHTATGTGGGLGSVLPVLLIALAAGGVGLAIGQRRRHAA
jgi:hypothetical protein